MSTNNEAIRELVTRMRRVETRLTAYMVSKGVEINAHPRWVSGEDEEGYVEVPALTSSLAACVSVVPEDYPFDEVEVRCGGSRIAMLDMAGVGL
jgi:hypothetical protein